MIVLLKEELLKKYPQLKESLAERYVTKYFNTMIEALAHSFATHGIENGELRFPIYSVRLSMGRMMINDNKEYIFNVMQQHASTQLIVVESKGNIGKESRVIFNPRYKKDIMDAIINLNVELNPDRLREYDQNANNSIDVDINSLTSYIRATRQTLNDSDYGTAYKDKLIRNLTVANQLLSMIKHKDGVDYLDEYWEQADAGRIYGHGLSLQRVAKEVRHAALGKTHKYDFKASSYALMTGIALAIDPTLKVQYIKDYIKYRSAQRKRIASYVGVSENAIKKVFTSLGFGAEVKNNPYNSIRRDLGLDNFEKLISNTEFYNIKTQLEAVSETILKSEHFSQDNFEWCNRTYSSIDTNTGVKRTKNQKLAWIYQATESYALGVFMAAVDQEPLLPTHDCLYYKRKLSVEEIEQANFNLLKEFPLLSFEHEEIQPISEKWVNSELGKAVNTNIYNHNAFILEQERLATNYNACFYTN